MSQLEDKIKNKNRLKPNRKKSALAHILMSGMLELARK